MTTVAKKQPAAARQLAYRVPAELAARVERVAERLGLDVSNFLRMMTVEQIGVYERRADRAEAGEGGEGGER
jgi:hypothetical protein